MSNDLTKELGFNFINYAAAVNTDRAIPDATCGLKPVARRIIYGTYEGGYTSNKAHVKCGTIVGDVMGHYHPHGDSSIYGALVRLSQPWIMRYPLLDFHGNMGNIGGDGPASYRYTEARLSKITEKGLLEGLKKKNVKFVPNYTESLEEPATLPSIFPNLLCNPNTGIGVAMACNWLPHNLGEVAQAIYDYIDGKEPMLPGPDFPTGGIIINKNDIPNILKTGHGSVKIRGKYEIKGNDIIFYEIPYGTSTEAIMNEIGEASDSKEIEGIVNVRDESTLKGLKIVIQCDKNASIDSIVRKLFLKTNLQTSISYNQVALVNKTPTELGLKDCIKIYMKHNINCLTKELNFDLKKAEDRLHIVEGLLIALEDIDNVIQLIKHSTNSSTAKTALIQKYNLSEVQAKSILSMRLSSLAHMEKIELENEKKELVSTIEDINFILQDSSRQQLIIRERLEELVKKFGDKRRTELAQITIKPEEKEIETITPEDCVVVLTKTGEIKRIPTKSFKVQRKNGKGVKTLNNAILDTISTNTIDTLMFFTNKGKMYRTIVDNIPVGTNAGGGTRIASLIKLEPNEDVIAITSLYRKTDAQFVVFFTKKGLIKKTYISEYTKVKRNTGIQAIKLNAGDSIANVTFLNKEEVVAVSKKGMVIHFGTEQINPIGRISSGVKIMKLDDDDEILNGLPIHNKNDYLAIISTRGYGKKTRLDEFPFQGRGGKGVLCYKVTNTTGDIIGAEMVADNDNLLLSGKPNSICISVKDIPLLTRLSIGNMLIKQSTISSVVKL